MNKNFLKVVFSEMIRIVTVPLRILPVKKNRILFTGLTGGNVYDYSCNPKYLYEYIRDNYPDRFEYIWAVQDKNMYRFLEKEGVKLVKHFTVSSFRFLLTSKVIVTNGSYTPWFPFRKKQYIINTWHGGGAYKKVENAKPDSDWATRKRAEFAANNIDLFVASCKMQEDTMIRETFHYKGEVLRAGTPRNDKLAQGEIGYMINRVKEYYNIPSDGKVVLYAPTYRYASSPVVLSADRLLAVLEQDGSEWFFLSRYHRYQEDVMNIKVEGRRVLDAVDYPDMQELLAAADILITDYSSCVWDYALLERPCFLYVPDWKEYTQKTGFYVELSQWPFLQADNMEKLLENIMYVNNNKTEMEKAKERMQEHRNRLGSYETGKSRQKLAKKILDKIDL